MAVTKDKTVIAFDYKENFILSTSCLNQKNIKFSFTACAGNEMFSALKISTLDLIKWLKPRF